ncbi:MAG TPA: hypothetical protein VMT01_04330, partial [Candidatus Acidoferrum sp.]|nr:hypothetical protein [Candidatus Acidoferrum sp.]
STAIPFDLFDFHYLHAFLLETEKKQETRIINKKIANYPNNWVSMRFKHQQSDSLRWCTI